MDILELPFTSQLGIQRDAEGRLVLPFSDRLSNHLATVYAGAQFTLAETASGDFLQSAFAQWVGRVAPVLREAEVRYRHPAESDLTAYAVAETADMQEVSRRLHGQGRALLNVRVSLRDAGGRTTLEGRYKWYIQRIPDTAVS